MSVGSIYQRKSDGRWCASIQVQGKRKSVYGKTEREVKAKLAKLQGELAKSNTLVTPGARTLNDLIDLWIETSDFRPITLKNLNCYFNRYVRNTIGTTRLSKLSPAVLQAYFNQLRTIAAPSVPMSVHQRLHSVLRFGVKLGWLVEPPTARVIVPKYEYKRKKLWTTEEMRLFLAEGNCHRLYPMFVFALATGLRLAELSGLKWGDIEETNGHHTVTIKRTLLWIKGGWTESKTKTKTSARTVTLPDEAVAALRRQRAKQAEWRLQSGAKWARESEWVFTDKRGKPVHRTTVAYGLAAICKKLKIRVVSPHVLRHQHVSLCLDAKVPLPAISARIGHNGPATTLRVYSHALSHQAEEVARAVQAALSG